MAKESRGVTTMGYLYKQLTLIQHTPKTDLCKPLNARKP